MYKIDWTMAQQFQSGRLSQQTIFCCSNLAVQLLWTDIRLGGGGRRGYSRPISAAEAGSRRGQRRGIKVHVPFLSDSSPHRLLIRGNQNHVHLDQVLHQEPQLRRSNGMRP